MAKTLSGGPAKPAKLDTRSRKNTMAPISAKVYERLKLYTGPHGLKLYAVISEAVEDWLRARAKETR